MRARLGLALAVLALAVVLPASAQAAAPLNDNYTSPVITNTPGTPMVRCTSSSCNFVQWTIPGNDAAGTINEATTQANLGDASSTPESITCTTDNDGRNISYWKTVWYRAFPDVSGFLRVNVTGGDAVIRIIPLSSTAATAVPSFGGSLCLDDPEDLANEDWTVGVEGGGGAAYAIQVGVYGNGFGTWTLQHRTRIYFLPDRDEDDTLDENDDCPTSPGPTNLAGCPDGDGDGVRNISDACPSVFGRFSRGCPDADGDGNAEGINDACPGERPTRDRLNNGCQDFGQFAVDRPSLPYTTLFSLRRGRFVRNGFRITGRLRLSGLPSGTSVRLRCSKRRTCRRVRTRRRVGRSGRVSFNLRRKVLRPGQSISIRITRSGYIGKYFSWKAKRRGKKGYTRKTRCMRPGSSRLLSCSRVSPDR